MKHLVLLFALMAVVAKADITYTDDVTLIGTADGVNYYDLSGGGAAPADVGDPFAWWKMTATGTNTTQILDFSDTGSANASNQPSVAGGPTLITTNGAFYSFDGADDKFSITNQPAFNTFTALTMSCWFNLSTEPESDSWMIMMSQYTSAGFSGQSYFCPKFGSALGFSEPARNKAGFALGDVQNGDGVIVMAGATTIAVSNWYHFVATWDGGLDPDSMELYINGTNDSLTGIEAGVFPGMVGLDANLYMGGRQVGGINSDANIFSGLLNDIRWFANEVLTPTQITNLYTEGAQ